MDLLANDIDNEVSQLADEMEMEHQQRELPYIEREVYYVYVFKPNDFQKARIRKLAADYESWYNAANELVSAYLPKRINDFDNYYKYKTNSGYGGLFLICNSIKVMKNQMARLKLPNPFNTG